METLLDYGLVQRGGGWRDAVGADRVALTAAIVTASAAVAAVLIATGGSVAAAAAASVALVIVSLSLFRVDLAFLAFLGMVLLFDQFIVVPSGDPLTASVHYFDNLKQIPWLPAASEGVMNPLEIQLALLLFGLFLAASAGKTVRLRRVPLAGLALLFLFSLAASMAYGLSAGGDLLPALWEVRALFYFLLLYFLVPQIIQTREQVRGVLWVMIILVAVKDLQGVARFAALGFHFNGNPCLTNHEDPVFTADLVVLLLGFLALGVRGRMKWTLLLLLLPMLLGFYTGQRRAAYAGLLLCVLVFLILLKPAERRPVFRILVPAVLVLACYTAAFWNSTGRLALPVQLIKSGLFTDQEDEGEHYSSNLYREVERYDLAVTAAKSPLIGKGFGKTYDQPLPLVPIPFPLRDWIPHDEILWLAVKMGGAGFLVFSLFFSGFLFETASLSRAMKDPFLRAISFMIAAAVVNQLVVSYFDLQLTFYRNMIFLGTACGLLPALKAIDGEERSVPRQPKLVYGT